MKIRLITVGALKNQGLSALIQTYRQRLKHFTQLIFEEVREVPVKKGMPAQVAADREAEAILEKLEGASFIIALDVNGKHKSTEQWVESFKQWESQSRKEITWVVGGAHGLSDSILRQAHERLSLSKLTFTHEMAQLIWHEQIYRVYTILRGVPYHH